MVEEESSPRKKGDRPIWRRPGIRITACLFLFLAAVLFCLPVATKLYLQKWLVDNGADKAIIQKVRLNLFTGVAALEGVDVQKDNNTVFADSTIYLNIGLKNILNRQALLQKAVLSNVQVEIERFADGSMRVGSYTLPAKKAENIDTPSAVAEKLEEDLPWIFRAEAVDISNVVVRYRQPDLSVELIIEESVIDKVNTDPDDLDGALLLKGSLNGAPFNLDLHALVIVPHVDIQGNISFSDLSLDDLADVLADYLKPFSGTADLKGTVAFSIVDDALRVHYDGSVNLTDGDIGGESWATKGTVRYDGQASFVMEEDMEVTADGNLQALNASFTMPEPVIDIENSDIGVSGKTTVTIGEEVVVDSGASLKLAPTAFAMDILKTAAGNTSWDGTVRVETGTESKGLIVQAEGSLNVEGPVYSMDNLKASTAQTLWVGSVHVDTGTASKGLTVQVDGSLQAEEPVYSMVIDDAEMEISEQLLAWNGKVEYSMGVGPDSRDYVRTHGRLDGEATSLTLPEVMQLSQDNLNLDGETEISLGSDIGVTHQGELVTEGTTVTIDGLTAGEKQLTWSGVAEYLLGDTSQTVTLNGDLTGNDISAFIEKNGLQINQQSVESSADFSLVLAEKPSVTGNISIGTGELQLNRDDIPLLTLANVSLTDALDNGSGGMIIGALDLEQLEIHSSGEIPVQVSIPSISLSDILSPDLMSAQVDRITVDQPHIADESGKTQLVQFNAITAQDIGINKDIDVTVGQVSVDKGIFVKEKDNDPVAAIGKLTLDQINYSPETGLVCSTVVLDSLFGNIHRQKAADTEMKQEEMAADPQQKRKKQPDADPEKVKKKTGIPVKINQVTVAGQSGFKFIDETLSRTFITELLVKSLEVKDIDLNRVDHPFTYSLNGAFDKYSPLDATGKCAPLGDKLFIEQKATLRNYSMQHVSPYSIDAIGTYFSTGRLDYTSDLKLAGGSINMKNNLVFKDLVTETVDGELAAELNNQLPVPLDMSLSMLRDRDGTIKLNIPLTGKVTEMDIGLADIMITALSKAITVAVTPYLAYTFLGPTGALVYAGTKLGEAMLNTDLPSLEFEPGSTELTESHREILNKVGKRIERQKKENYSICARVGIGELESADSDMVKNQFAKQNEAIRRELFKLGESRSLAVKDYLVSTFKIDENRLMICNPGLNFQKGSKPLVEFKK